MALSNFVKINHVSSLSDARYCAGMGVDILGFSLDEGSASFINPQQFKEITQWVSGPKFAGELGSAGMDEIKLATIDYSLDFIEISVPDHLIVLEELNIPIIFKTAITAQKDIDQLKKIISYGGDLLQYIHLELESTFLNNNQSLLSDLKKPLILNIHSPSENLALIGTHGISLTAQTEQETGLQDYGEIMDVLEALEVED